jgi:hypothetical protein
MGRTICEHFAADLDWTKTGPRPDSHAWAQLGQPCAKVVATSGHAVAEEEWSEKPPL